jgi:hypothetical protein
MEGKDTQVGDIPVIMETNYLRRFVRSLSSTSMMMQCVNSEVEMRGGARASHLNRLGPA